MTSSLTGHISILQYILQRKSAGGRRDGRGAGGGGGKYGEETEVKGKREM